VSRRTVGKNRRPASQPEERKSVRRPPLAWLGWVALAMGASWTFQAFRSPVAQAEAALGRGDHREAFQLALGELEAGRRTDRLLCVAGVAALALAEPATAGQLFTQVSERDPVCFAVAARELGRLATGVGHVVEAEQHLKNAVRLAPGDSEARDALVYLWLLEGRLDEARRLVLEQFQAGMISPNYLQVITPSRPSLATSVEYARHCLAARPEDTLPRLALARRAWRDGRAKDALVELDAVQRNHPELVDARALRTLILAETDGDAAVPNEPLELSPELEGHHEYWLAHGLRAERWGHRETAARCFWESLKRNPDAIQTNHRLSQVLVGLGRTKDATLRR
jgi:tetratricopeptide (TPR) repeat protein